MAEWKVVGFVYGVKVIGIILSKVGFVPGLYQFFEGNAKQTFHY